MLTINHIKQHNNYLILNIKYLLLDNKANPNTRNKRQFTALMYAVMNSKVVNLLLAQNADVNALTIFGESALYWACFFRNIKVIKILLKVGINLNKKKMKVEEHHCTLPVIWVICKWLNSLFRQKLI